MHATDSLRAVERHRRRTRTPAQEARRFLFRLVAIPLAVLVVSATSVAAIAGWSLTATFNHNLVDISNGQHNPAPAQYSGAFNVLLVGEDNAAGQKGFGAARSGTLNDVNILVHVSADHHSGAVISVPRDLIIAQPACTDPASHAVAAPVSGRPLNTAFGRGGLGCVVASVEQLTGVTIPYAALFSFQGTVAMADAVGGVPVCVSHAIHDRYSGLNLPAGRSIITGRTALAYLRSRHGVGDGSDLARISSQQAYMSALLRKLTSSSTLSSPTNLYSLASAAAKSVHLSTSLADPATLVGMMLAIKSINLHHVVLVQYPTVPDPMNINKVIPNTALAAALISRVRSDSPIGLSPSTHGYSTTHSATAKSTTRPSAPAASPTPSHSAAPDPLRGLSGQTASDHTCSVAAGG